MLSRRLFLALAGTAITLHPAFCRKDTMPNNLDHIVLGSHDLDQGIAWLEARTGVRAALGGVHPGRGTRNALLALGPHCYLEILAPDPRQSSLTWYTQLPTLREPRLVAWAVHTTDLAAVAGKCAAAGYPIDGPSDYSRARPDGKTLRWKLFHLKDDRDGLLPFFIEWAADSIHPAVDTPPGCMLTSLQLESPHPNDLAKVCQTLGVDVPVMVGQKQLLRARITSPKGEVEFTS
jgi:hypothetical protein